MTFLLRVFALLTFSLGTTLLAVRPFKLHNVEIIALVPDLVHSCLGYYGDLFDLWSLVVARRTHKATNLIGRQTEYSRQRKTVRFFLLIGMRRRLL
jgi:hypothetical protein